MLKNRPMFQSIPHMLFESVTAYAERDAFRYRYGGRTIRVSYTQFGETLQHLTHGLATLDIRPGTRIGILSENRVEWVVADLAAMILGCIVVPIHTNITPVQVADLIEDAGVEVLFVSNRYYFEQIMSVKDRLTTLNRILSFDPIKAGSESPTTFERLVKLGEKHQASRPGMIKRLLDAVNPDEACSIVYTSGTSGQPKGVCLHHRGFVNNTVRSEAAIRLSTDDVFLSYLPLSFLYERLAGHWCALYRGCTIYYGRAPETLQEDLRMAKPTVLVGVPRMYEEIMFRASNRMRTGRLMSRLLLQWGLDIGRRYRKRHRHLTGWVRFQYGLADWFVYRTFRQRLGGRLRLLISGGAPLSADVDRFFRIMGLPIMEGYGLTETHLVVAVSSRNRELGGGCGKPIPGVEVKVTRDGEILVRSDTIMLGYRNQPDETEKVMLPGGWFRTGDLGHIDEEGLLHVTDRIHDMILTSGGELIAPSPIENRIRRDGFIDDILLVGNGRPFLTALIIANRNAMKSWGEKHEMDMTDEGMFLTSPEVNRFLMKRINRRQSQLAEFEKVQQITVVTSPFTVESGELTPTYKKRRSVLEERYWPLIEAMYGRNRKT